MFQDANILVLSRVRLDHHPILVQLKDQEGVSQVLEKPFRFEAI